MKRDAMASVPAPLHAGNTAWECLSPSLISNPATIRYSQFVETHFTGDAPLTTGDSPGSDSRCLDMPLVPENVVKWANLRSKG